jgi:hypothetical protein
MTTAALEPPDPHAVDKLGIPLQLVAVLPTQHGLAVRIYTRRKLPAPWLPDPDTHEETDDAPF